MKQNNTKPYAALRTSLLTQRQQIEAAKQQRRAKALTTHFIAWLRQQQSEHVSREPARHTDHKTITEAHTTDRDTVMATQGPLTIAAFWPIRQEPNIRELMHQLHSLGHKVALPKVVTKDAPLQFFNWTPDTPMVTGAYNIDEPALTAAAQAPDIVLVPTLAYGTQGERLGYGGGYYDRTIAQWHHHHHYPLLLGVTWSDLRLPDDYVAQKHDCPLDGILTEAGLHFFERGRD